MDKKKKYGLNIDYFGNTHVGLVREENQDSFSKFPANSNDVYLPKGQLFIVADGIGGPAYGREASKSAIEIILNVFQKMPDDNIVHTLKLAFETANSKIFNSFRGNSKHQKMGASVSALVIKGNRAYIAHVGNCRIYHISKNNIEVVTAEHTVVNEQRNKNLRKNDDSDIKSTNAVLEKAIGFASIVDVDIIKNLVIHSGDSILLCSDGLAGIDNEAIRTIVTSNNAESACNTLMNLAVEKGGEDNITLQVIKVSGHDLVTVPENKENESNQIKKNLRLVLTAFVALTVAALGLIFYETVESVFSKPTKEVIESKAFTPEAFDTRISLDEASVDNLVFRAEQFFIEGKLDSSVILYNHVLKKNPEHTISNEALKIISQTYKEQADNLLDSAVYVEAQGIYYKAYSLQPADYELAELINYCEIQIESASNEEAEVKPEVSADNSNTGKIIEIEPQEIEVLDKTIEKIETEVAKIPDASYSFWKIGNLIEGDYLARGNDLIFHSTAKMKMGLNSYMLQGFKFEIEATYNKQPYSKRAGVIVGFYQNDNSGSDSYFLVSINDVGNLQLQKVTGLNAETIASIPIEKNFNMGKHHFNLKVDCTGNKISIFNDNVLLKTYENTYLVIGKIGLFADPYTNVEFSNFKLTPN
jgi:serine/threonine protein phosphatase PrpC